MENMEDFCVSHIYSQRKFLLLPYLRRPHCRPLLLLLRPPPSPSLPPLTLPPLPLQPSLSSFATATDAAEAAILLKFHSKHVTIKNKTKHIMKISHINVNIYDKTTATSLKMLNEDEN